MDDRNSFADDLTTLRENISEDVGDILKVVRERKTSKPSSPEVASTSQSNENPIDSKAANVKERQPRPTPRPKADESVVLENVTTRLHRDTNERLTEAALRQKLKKEEPDTRQGIIEVALREWLKRQQYI